MFGRIGMTQILVVLGLFMLLFGYKRLPELGKSLGKGLRDFRKATSGEDEGGVTPEKAE